MKQHDYELLPSWQNINQHHHDIDEICYDLKHKIPLNCFWHTRWYDNYYKLDLCNSIAPAEWYYKNQLFDHALTENPLKPTDRCFLFTDIFDEEELHMQMLGLPLAKHFDIAHLFFFFDPHDDYYDVYFLGMPNEVKNANEIYLRNLHHIEQFIKNYNIKADHIISNAKRQRLLQHEPMISKYLLSSVNKTLRLIPNSDQKHFFNANLTRREIECLYWFKQGKTVPEMSIIMNISKRTTETYVANLKAKFGCVNLFQLGGIIGRYNKFFDLLFREVAQLY